jgi:hypothetical protein
MVRWASRGIQSDTLHAEARIEDESAVVTIDAFDSSGNLQNYQGLDAHLEAPDSTDSSIAMVQTSSGKYEGRFSLNGRGAYLLTVGSKESGALHVGFDFSKLPEDRGVSANESFLSQLAQIAANRNEIAPGYKDAWPWAAMIAILLFLFELAIKRRAA